MRRLTLVLALLCTLGGMFSGDYLLAVSGLILLAMTMLLWRRNEA